MIPTTIHQFWLEEGEKPEAMGRVKTLAETSGLSYKCWSWKELIDKFGAYSFLTEENGFPEKRVLQFIENFYSWLVLSDAPGIYVMKHAELPYDLEKLHEKASVFIGGKLYGEDPSVIATTNIDDVAMLRGAILALYERNKDLLSFASSALLLSLHGLTCLQRIIMPCLRYNNIPYAYLETPQDIIRTSITPVHQMKPVTPTTTISSLIAPEEDVDHDEEDVKEEAAAVQVSKVFVQDDDTKPAFWLPDGTKRIFIFTNDLMDIDFYQFNPGDCIVHVDEARYADELKSSTAASHILFIDAYPRSRMRTPSSFNMFRHVVFYDKRTGKEWKQKFVEEVNAAPSMVCCIAQEYKLKYPDLPVKVCGIDLTALSRAGLRKNCEAERKWLKEAGVEVTQRHYTCMFLLLDVGGDRQLQQESWLKDIPGSCMYRYVVDKEEADTDEIAAPRSQEDPLGLVQAIRESMEWNWTYLYVGTTSTKVNVGALMSELINKPEEGGSALHTERGYEYNIQPGFFLSRNQAAARLKRANMLLKAVIDLPLHDRFVPLPHMEVADTAIGSVLG